jgi:dTMP kinase
VSGQLIVLEGIDGSGKSTQYRRLCERLESEGRSFRKITFPRYSEESSALIRMYLNGDFGTRPGDVNAFAASAFYAADRFASYKTDWGEWYENGGLVLCDRYTTSNACHQGSKLDKAALPDYFDWLVDFEYKRMELPRPQLVIYLNTELEVSLAQLAERQHDTNTQGDIHEKDIAYMRSTLETGRAAAEHYGWRVVNSVENGKLRTIEDIHAEIYAAVSEVIK